ncbi:glycoside hydrolase family 76 protein [Pseudoflavitalea sp. X16]|uniref:glycoside hydrolase family 76 protein n=1 Tax=Paraflavitalea devenefica TaxID=2716334 RepID=UPI001423441B|nr:glycoside hydrolase family 76 protein [Paraflavitalea devenefica]NII26078.1 glycoside hydrolase family 76 protein [Paraflavitalea devenefica]
MKPINLFLLLSIALLTACSKKSNTPVVTTPKPVAFTAQDATAAFNTFNTYFYSPVDKLYYNTTEKKAIGSIWTQAIFWDLAMDAYRRTNDAAYLQLVKDIYQGGFNRYSQYDWENKTTWFIYDDIMWWVISLARASEMTGNSDYLTLSQSGFQRVWRDAYDAVKGGMWWDFNKTGKNACINFPTVIAAMQLYKLTNDAAYLDKAKTIYDWSVINLVNTANGRVADNNINGNKGWSDYTYNQGTYIGASVLLYKALNNNVYLNNAKLAADYTQKTMCDVNSILPAEGDWNEQGVLKAIFARYIMMLIKDTDQSQYLAWIRKNINKAWGNRDPGRGLMYRNYNITCPPGTIQSYEASSAVAFMQLCPPEQ